MKKLSPFPALMILFVSSLAFAAADKVRITNVADINLGNWTMSSMTGNDPVCVYHNNGISTYRVTATDNSTLTPSGFYLQNAGATAQIAYAVRWGNTPSPGTIPLADGVTLPASGANTANSNCGGGDSANFKIDINNSDLAAVPSGTYTATITLVTQP